MKYQNWVSFEKHLNEAAPHHLSLVYLAVTSCSYERKKIFHEIVKAIQKKDKETSIESYDTAETSIDTVIDQLNSLPLFSGFRVVTLDGIDKLKKEGLESLATYSQRPSPFCFLILGASTAKNLTALYQKGKKEVIALDLSDEKPWDRKSRLERHLFLVAQKEGKSLNPDAAAYLLDHIGLNLANLEQEMLKLLCFVGERQKIGLDDVRKICPTEKSSNSWQLAESVIWETSLVKTEPLIDLSWLLAFIGQLRYQLQTGCQIASYLEQKMTPDEIGRLFPQMRGGLLDKRIASIKKLKTSYFRSSLHLLFDIELTAKNSSLSPALLLDLFLAKLHHLKNTPSL